MVDQAATKKKKKSRPKRNQAVLPTWWMELTPHYTLDLDDELSRRLRDERMALYYSQLAEEEASKGMMFDIDGNPITVEEQAANTANGSGWKNNWAGRQPKDGNKNGNNGEGAEKPKMFGGRNFKPGSPGWDAKQWGIDEKDPDLEKYQSGERLPPQFIAAMNNFAKATGHYQANAANVEFANANLKSSGVYGGAAERMAHQPDWMKKKLRSSTAGQSIRHGVYDDSPNKHLKYQEARRNKDLEEQGGDENGAGGQQPPEEEPATPEQEQEAPTPRRAAPRSAPQQNKMDMDDEDPSVMVFSAPEPLSSMQPPSKEKQPEETTTTTTTETTPKSKFNFKDFYYNASTQQTSNVGQNNSTAAAASPAPAPAAAAPVAAASGGKKKWPTVQTTPSSAGGTAAAAEEAATPTATETPTTTTSNNNSAATGATTPAAKKWTPPTKKATPPAPAPAPAPAPKKWAPKPPEPAPAPAAPVTGPAANLVAPAPNSRWAPKAIVTSSAGDSSSEPVKATSWNAPKPTATRTATPVKPSWNKTTPTTPEQAPAMPGIPDPDNMYEEEEEEYEEEEVYDEEEVVEEEHTEEEILEEEEVIEEEEVADDTSLEDLQATLAAKMAELKKLQAM